ncbi:nucleoside-binding protein [Anaerovirgula multivorans]|uniref:Nucleoside-binding protein n=1 Tax=Anaerovirgula multivorans TaxID=312168 RepID=A0A239K603_9FIRM|nr:BMP family ABC transporter substrate-binding protein [Anaerovirgula multivorans]SNT13178.1 nucleoside-binding protein [Anaerovirgula multivorans]
MFKKMLALMLVLLLMATALVGCGGGAAQDPAPEEDQEQVEDQPTEEQIKMAMVTDVGGVNDQSFNESAWNGHKQAEAELGFSVSYVESEQDADYERNLETLLDAGNDLIWGIGFMMTDAILEAAEFNPDQKYAIIDPDFGENVVPENLVGVLFKAEEGSFLVGYIAGKMTETNKVGFVGGMDFPVIHGFHYGFMAGVKHANPDAEVLVQYADSFVDAARGKAIANQMYQQGADIVFHAAGGAGDGVIEAAREQDKYAIGVDEDQNHLAPDHVITSAMKRVDNAIFMVAEMLKDGDYAGGETKVFGLADGGVGIAPTSDKHVPAEILEEVKQVEQEIIAGKIVVPNNKDDYEANY